MCDMEDTIITQLCIDKHCINILKCTVLHQGHHAKIQYQQITAVLLNTKQYLKNTT